MDQNILQNSWNVPGERSYILQTKSRMAVASTSTVNPDEIKFIADSGASMQEMSKMDLSLEEFETVKVSRRPRQRSRRMGRSTQPRSHSLRKRPGHVRDGPTS